MGDEDLASHQKSSVTIGTPKLVEIIVTERRVLVTESGAQVGGGRRCFRNPVSISNAGMWLGGSDARK
jgi:hypothetical protein